MIRKHFHDFFILFHCVAQLQRIVWSVYGLTLTLVTSSAVANSPIPKHHPTGFVEGEVRGSDLNDPKSDKNKLPWSVKNKSVWLIDETGSGTWESEIETKWKKEKRGLEFNIDLEKEESKKIEYELEALASYEAKQNTYLKVGTIYQYNDNLDFEKQNIVATAGLEWFTDSKIKFEHYLYSDFKDYSAMSFDIYRTYSLSEMSTLKPYVEMDLILKDQTAHAGKTGLNQVQMGVEGRYAFNEHIIPFFDLAYEYSKGQAQTSTQNEENSSKEWLTEMGIEFRF